MNTNDYIDHNQRVAILLIEGRFCGDMNCPASTFQSSYVEGIDIFETINIETYGKTIFIERTLVLNQQRNQGI